jgi:uncharacterized protein YbjT (DUF2867 family)
MSGSDPDPAGMLFITGITGFVGQSLSPLITAWPGGVRLLVRTPPDKPFVPGAEIISGELTDPDSYRLALDGVTTLVHMAALVGKAAPPDYMAVNVAATQNLLSAARTAGVRNILFVSSIAAGYKRRRHYAYAESKIAAERVVAEAGLPYTILRPTFILGPGSPIGKSLAKIARLPVLPLPQVGRPSIVQPVHVDDVAEGIVTILREGRYVGETLDLGGPEPLPMADFLNRIRKADGKEAAKIIPIPYTPLQWAMGLLEPLRESLPITAGQLSSFVNDSTAQPNWLMDRLAPSMRSLDMMIDSGPAGSGPGQVGAESLANTTTPADLKAEGKHLSRYLAGIEASPGTLTHYVRGCRILGLDRASGLDGATLRLAQRSLFGVRAADAYCAMFWRRGILRRRLSLLTAVLENTPEGYPAYEPAQAHGPVRAAISLMAAGVGFICALFAGTVLLTLARLRG